MGNTLEKLLSAFLAGFFAFLLPNHIAILSLFCLVIINAIAKTVAVLNDEDVKFWQIWKILKRSECVSYTLYSIVGYSIAITSVALLEYTMFGGVGITVGTQTVNLTYLIIMISVSHVFGSIFKSVEDILKHPLFDKMVDKMPKWLKDMIKPEEKKKRVTKKKEEE